MKKDVLKVSDLSRSEMTQLIERAITLKSGKGITSLLAGKSIGLLFEKPSTRTRVSFEVGIFQLGGHPVCMSPAELQLGRGETISDTAKTLSRYLDAIVIRTSAHERLLEFAAAASIPVINGLSDRHHPCQAFADVMTMQEKFGNVKGLRAAFIGDGNNVCNSLIEAAALMEFHLSIACPEGFEPDSQTIETAEALGTGRTVVMQNPKEAAAMADVLYTDVWVSMGQEENGSEKKQRFKDYQVNQNLLAVAKKGAMVLHCLPAHRGEEITDDVMDSPASHVFDQAENRLHAQKALLEMILT